MAISKYPIAIVAAEAPLRAKPSNYGKWKFTRKDGSAY